LGKEYEINWEKIAETVSEGIIKTTAWEKFCNEYCREIEDQIREAVRAKWIDKTEKNFNFNDDECPEDEMEFILTLEGDLSTSLMKYFVVNYLGRKW